MQNTAENNPVAEKENIWLFRDDDDDLDNSASYSSVFAAAHFHASFLPVLDKPLISPEILAETLSRCKDSDGIVITSQRSVKALQNTFSYLRATNVDLCNFLLGLPCFCIGHATQRMIKNDLGLHVVEEEKEEENNTGCSLNNAESLARFILSFYESKQIFATRLLYICGDKRRDTLPNILLSSLSVKVELNQIIAYNTLVMDGIVERLNRQLILSNPQWFVFFSPLGVKAVLPWLRMQSNGRFYIAAIGKTTAEALQGFGYVVNAIAIEPSAAGICQVICEHMLHCMRAS